MTTFECFCGSGLPMRKLNDARKIFVSHVCDECEDRTKRSYRPEIFTDPNYATTEPVEPDFEDDEDDGELDALSQKIRDLDISDEDADMMTHGS